MRLGCAACGRLGYACRRRDREYEDGGDGAEIIHHAGRAAVVKPPVRAVSSSRSIAAATLFGCRPTGPT
jgi:hypothetical protein